MKATVLKHLLLSALALSVGGVMAAPPCTKEPKGKWMPEDKMRRNIEAMGYKIDRFLVSGTCYEIYGRNKEGRKAEVYFNPVDGKIVKQRLGKRAG